MNTHEHTEDCIKYYLLDEDVNHKGLYEDLFDLMYSEVEYQFQKNKDVEFALRDVIIIVCTEGAHLIKKDLIHLTLITYKIMSSVNICYRGIGRSNNPI